MTGLSGKRVVVAGAASGIGAATAERLAAEGARVIVGDINLEGARGTVARILAAGGEAQAIHFDLAEEASTQALIGAAVEYFGGLDGLANVGAETSPAVVGADTDLLSTDLAIWQRTLQVNLMGFAFTCRAAIRQFIQQGTGGAIVNVSSIAANATERVRVAYAASKAGVNALTRHIAITWGRQGIRCNAIAPGFIMTEGARAITSQEFKDKWLESIPAGRFGRPDDPAGIIVFLLSPDTTWVIGQVWHVNGGSHFRE